MLKCLFKRKKESNHLATFIFPGCYNKEYQPKNLHITLPTTTSKTTGAAVVL